MDYCITVGSIASIAASVCGYETTFGVGFSATIFSGNINYGRTQINWDSLIPNLVRQK